MSALRIWKQISPICLALVVVVNVGCKDVTSQYEPPALDSLTGTTKKTASDGQPTAAPGWVAPNRGAPKKSIAIPAIKPDDIYEPKVVLSQAHGQTCLVNVGDTLPNLELQSVTGELVSLDEFRGDTLTVVVFWTNRLAFGRAQFKNLAAEVALPFRHLGVRVVAVNVRDPAEQIELEGETRDGVTCLLDPDGSAVAKVRDD